MFANNKFAGPGRAAAERGARAGPVRDGGRPARPCPARPGPFPPTQPRVVRVLGVRGGALAAIRCGIASPSWPPPLPPPPG